jgi:hypothetical protein
MVLPINSLAINIVTGVTGFSDYTYYICIIGAYGGPSSSKLLNLKARKDFQARGCIRKISVKVTIKIAMVATIEMIRA